MERFAYQECRLRSEEMNIIRIASHSSTNVEGIENLNVLKIDAEPQLIQILSEPCLTFTRRGYQPIVRVMHKKTKREYILFISSRSLAEQVEQMRVENNGQFTGLEFWIRKTSYDRMAPYVVEPF